MSGSAALDLARQRQRARRTSENVQRGSTRTLTCMPRSRWSSEAAQAELFEQRLDLERDPAHVGPGDSRAGIEIDA